MIRISAKWVVTLVDGVVPEGNDLYNLVMDAHDNVWFMSSRSLVRFNPGSGKFISLSEKEGFQSQQYNIFTTCSIKVGGGDFIVDGGYQGLDYIMPEKIKESYPPSQVYLRSLEINQQPFPMATGINNVQEIVFEIFSESDQY